MKQYDMKNKVNVSEFLEMKCLSYNPKGGE